MRGISSTIRFQYDSRNAGERDSVLVGLPISIDIMKSIDLSHWLTMPGSTFLATLVNSGAES